jgi:hypothetical protein
MGFEFKSDQEPKQLVDSKTTLSVNAPLVGEQAVGVVIEENLTQPIFAEGEEEKLAIQFIEENELYVKFMLWCGIQDQLKNLKSSLASTNE